jgi:hypothetical protein
MLKQLNEVKNALTILLAVFFVAILTVAKVCVACNANDSSDCNSAVVKSNTIWEWGK